MNECPNCQKQASLEELVVFKDEYDDWKLGCKSCIRETVIVPVKISQLREKTNDKPDEQVDKDKEG